MWVFLSNSMLSIVNKPGDNDILTVRARAKGDIERVFPNAKVEANKGTDYAFRARISREAVANAMFDAATAITYANFKGSVREDDRHDAYMDAWHAMMRFQTKRNGKLGNQRQKDLLAAY